jgi:hypothetical protein
MQIKKEKITNYISDKCINKKKGSNKQAIKEGNKQAIKEGNKNQRTERMRINNKQATKEINTRALT